MFCAFCGSEIPEDGLFCPSCGKKVLVIEENTTAEEVKEAPKAEVVEEAKEELKAEVVEEAKEELKAEVAEEAKEAKEEPKAEVAEEAKEETKIEVAEEVKEEAKAEEVVSPQEVAVAPVTNQNTQGGTSSQECSSESTSKFDIKSFLTPENIERFAPMVAFLPFIMFVVTGIFSAVVHVFPWEWLRVTIMVVLKLLFCGVAIAADVGLFYVVIKKKDTERVWSWLVPVVGIFALIGCICVCFHWTAVGLIFGLITFVMGLDFLARITIPNGQMDSKINVGDDVATYKSFYQSYREKYPSTKELERKGIKDPENSYFDGSGIELLGLMLAAALMSCLTCGIATPWAICMVYKWRINHTVVNGKRFNFDGTGASLLGHWILWELLTVITCGIYGFFTYVAVKKWILSHTYIEGEMITAGTNGSYFDGNSFEYMGYSILLGLITIFTLTIGAPWGYCMLQKWDTKHQVVCGRRMVFSGSGLGFLGEFLLIELLTLITCGIYQPWGIVRINKYIVRHTDFVYKPQNVNLLTDGQ